MKNTVYKAESIKVICPQSPMACFKSGDKWQHSRPNPAECYCTYAIKIEHGGSVSVYIGIFLGMGISWIKIHSIGRGIGKYRYFSSIGKNNTDPPTLHKTAPKPQPPSQCTNFCKC